MNACVWPLTDQQERERERAPPLTFVTGALLRIYYSASTEEGRGPCVTHVHFNAITASSVRGSKWPRRKIPPPRFRVVASDGKKKTRRPSPSLPKVRDETTRRVTRCDGGMSSWGGGKNWKWRSIDRARNFERKF